MFFIAVWFAQLAATVACGLSLFGDVAAAGVRRCTRLFYVLADARDARQLVGMKPSCRYARVFTADEFRIRRSFVVGQVRTRSTRPEIQAAANHAEHLHSNKS
jgi:hypothetical protein